MDNFFLFFSVGIIVFIPLIMLMGSLMKPGGSNNSGGMGFIGTVAAILVALCIFAFIG